MKALKENINQTKIGEVKPKLKKTFTDLTYSKANLDLMQVQCKMHNAMHDDKQIFFGFFENKEIQKAKE